MHVCVLGAGIAGLAAAYQLSESGHRITVVDQSEPGSGASGANGGQLSYSYVQPLADPTIWRQLPKLLLSRDSPLKIRPQLDPQQWAWGLRFLRACNAARATTTTARLLELAAASREGFDAFRLRERVDADFSATGKLVLYRTAAGFDAARRQLALQRRLGGAPQEALDAAEAMAVEPALAATQSQIAGAIHTPSECAADCAQVCEALVRVLTARGVRFVLGTPVTGWVRRGERLAAARIPGGEIEADAFVLSLGAGSPTLARAAGVSLALVPLKGYSLTLDMPPTGAAPRASITDAARKVVFAPLGRRLRVAGMAELVGQDRSIPQARIASLVAATHALLPGAAAATPLRPWAGLRPATPTGEPLVGRHPRGPVNLLLNTGHGALGFTLAFGTARQVQAALESPA